MTFLTLDIEASILAFAMGALFLFLGRGLGIFFLLVMLYFLVISAVVTYTGYRYKKNSGLFQKQRGVKNVVANGLWPLVMVIAYFVMQTYGIAGQGLMVVGFVASVAAVSADKFSSEIGILDGMPRSIIGFNKVDKGVSGGITALGLCAGFVGGLLIAVTPIAVNASLTSALPIIVAASAGGFAGTLFDSVLGWFEEKNIGNKFTSNFFASVLGSIIGIVVFVLI